VREKKLEAESDGDQHSGQHETTANPSVFDHPRTIAPRLKRRKPEACARSLSVRRILDRGSSR
jgi:hypothetical protein